MKKHDSPHKYYKTQFNNSGTTIYRCGLPGCPHFVYEALIIGRISICCRCDEQYVIMKKTLNSKKLHCEDCTRGKFNKPRVITKEQEVKKDNLEEFLGLLGNAIDVTSNKGEN